MLYRINFMPDWCMQNSVPDRENSLDSTLPEKQLWLCSLSKKLKSTLFVHRKCPMSGHDLVSALEDPCRHNGLSCLQSCFPFVGTCSALHDKVHYFSKLGRGIDFVWFFFWTMNKARVWHSISVLQHLRHVPFGTGANGFTMLNGVLNPIRE